MKLYSQAIILLTTAVILSACGVQRPIIPMTSESQTVGSDMPVENQQELIDRCSGYLDDFRNGKFDRFYKDAGKSFEMKSPQEKIVQEWTALSTQARAYNGTQSAQSELEDGKIQIQISSVHSRYNIFTTFTFADNETIEGLSFRLTPLIVEPKSDELWEELPITLGYDSEKKLNGMLTLPKNTVNPPIVILVPGSGAQGMDSLIGAANNRPFADLAQGLAERGIASIRYDKRSYAYPEDVVDIETEYLYDVKDAVHLALKEPRIDGSRIYLIGHSQGGMLSPKLALDSPEIKGIVSLGGTLRRIEDIILEQHETMMAQNTTLSEQEKNDHIAQIKKELDHVRSLNTESPDDRNELLLGYPVSYWISLNTIENKEIAKNLTIPMLILQGDNDFQVLYETDFKLWQEVLKDKQNVSFKHYAGLSHVFMPGSRESFDSSSYDPPANMNNQVIHDIADWILSLG